MDKKKLIAGISLAVIIIIIAIIAFLSIDFETETPAPGDNVVVPSKDCLDACGGDQNAPGYTACVTVCEFCKKYPTSTICEHCKTSTDVQCNWANK